MTMLPGIDATTGEIVQINPEMFLALSRADQEEFMRDLPTALEALDRGMGADGRIFNKYKDAVKNFVSEVRQKDKIVRESDIENHSIFTSRNTWSSATKFNAWRSNASGQNGSQDHQHKRPIQTRVYLLELIRHFRHGLQSHPY
jgi:hypothetical protein